MRIHLYMLCYRFEALVASHLDPEAFGLYMAVGTHKNTRGNLLFFEIDPELKSDYFRLENLEELCSAMEDGVAKPSKYISVYRVMEHLPLAVYGKLYLTTADGRTLPLSDIPYQEEREEKGLHLYDELCPLNPMVLSTLAPGAFRRFMTDPLNRIHVPRIFFADMLLDRDSSGRLAGYLPYQDPAHIQDCCREMESKPAKPTKTVFRAPRLSGFFRTIRRGFYLGDSTGIRFYPFPSRNELEVQNHWWWRSASESLVS